MVGKRNIRLRTSGDVSHFLAKLINGVWRGEVEPARAGKLAYMANILLASLRNDKLGENTSVVIVPPKPVDIVLKWCEDAEVEPEPLTGEGDNGGH